MAATAGKHSTWHRVRFQGCGLNKCHQGSQRLGAVWSSGHLGSFPGTSPLACGDLWERQALGPAAQGGFRGDRRVLEGSGRGSLSTDGRWPAIRSCGTPAYLLMTLELHGEQGEGRCPVCPLWQQLRPHERGALNSILGGPEVAWADGA